MQENKILTKNLYDIFMGLEKKYYDWFEISMTVHSSNMETKLWETLLLVELLLQQYVKDCYKIKDWDYTEHTIKLQHWI